MLFIKVSWFRKNFLVSSVSFKKQMKISLPEVSKVVKSNLFVRFLEETSAWKNHFKFVWPLAKLKTEKCLYKDFWHDFRNLLMSWVELLIVICLLCPLVSVSELKAVIFDCWLEICLWVIDDWATMKTQVETCLHSILIKTVRFQLLFKGQ